MSVSPHARLLLIGLWTEAFDDGVFEWKPLTLKARIFPVDNVDVNELLLDLVEAGFIARIESHPKKPGVIRNFQRYQRPKKPNSSGMLSSEWLDFVGSKGTTEASGDDGPELVPNQYGTGGEKHPQMEDGGGKRERDQNEKETRERAEFSDWFCSWPSSASDDDDEAFAAWSELTEDDRSEAKSKSAAYVEAAKQGGRTTICSAAKYLRKRMWTRLAKVRATATAPPKTPEQRAAEKAAHIQSLIAHNKSW